jgi:Tfp pilus assembly protein PilO
MDKKFPPKTPAHPSGGGQPRAEKILLALILIITIISLGYTFYKTVVQQDFEVVNTEPIEAADDASAE